MIRSTFAGFTTAQLGMAASQRALDVTGQNIANINTTGYTRQRLDVASLNSKYGNFYNSENNIQPGFGVDMTGISQLRDPFLDMQYRNQMAILGTSDAHVATLEDLTPIFDETTMEGIKIALTSITTALDKFSTQVENQEFDSMVRSNMQILLNLFHENATRLEEVRNDTQQGFKDNDIKDLNQLLENIAELNRSIKNSNILGNPALELKDQRNNLLDELASYLPISVKYTDKPIGPGQTVEVLDVYFTDSEGQKFSLVSDGDFGSFDTDISGQPVTLTIQDARGTQTKDITDTIQSGTLRGTLDMLNKSGTFDNTDVNGIGYYEKALDSLVGTFAETFNKLNTPLKKDASGAFIPDGKGGYELENPNTRPLFEKIDTNLDWSADNIKIADGWMDGTYGLTASITPDADGKIGSTDSSNILRMIDAMKADQQFVYNGRKFFEGSFYDCFTGIENTLAIDTKANNTMLTNQITVLNQTANSRDSVSGVQLDEEGMNLMHYNQSYTAAARLMTTLDEALDTLINNTGVVGR